VSNAAAAGHAEERPTRNPGKRLTKRLATARSGELRCRAHWLAVNERKSEGHAHAQFADRTAIDRGVAKCRVEGELVIHLPYGPDQTRERLRLGDDAVRIDFKNLPDLPFVRSLDDGIEKELTMLVGVRFDAAFK
jgi:hypothetical protein